MKKETILVWKKEVTSNSHKSKRVYYKFKTKIGWFEYSVYVEGNFRGVVADKNFHETTIENVHEHALYWFKRSDVYPSEKNFRLHEERKREEEEEERIEREREEKQRVEEERRKEEMASIDLNKIDIEELIGKINEIWNGEEKQQDVVFNGIRIVFKRGQSITDCYKNIKIVNAKLGLSFTIKRKEPNYDIENVLNTAFRFIFEVHRLGEKIKNKGIVMTIAKKQGAPSIKTLKENGFTIDNKTYQLLDLNAIDDVKKLFEYYNEFKYK
ncbi:hypothetical protein [Prevotella falsenii]|uniref:hypothetical protein n=1 Tax=Prevotella falsenii TaxID=515414 RepID=UPI000469EE45|nr:hypothetical protein [Prevotella falsenii]